MNKLLFFIMYFCGNILYFNGGSQLPTYYLVFQLIVGWTLTGLMVLFGTLVCLVVPVILCVISYQSRV